MRRNTEFMFLGLLVLLSIGVAYLMATVGMVVGIGILALLCAVTMLVVIFTDYRKGYLVLVVYSFFLFHISRIAPFQFPWGIFVEVFYLLLFVAILFNNRNADKDSPSVFKNPIGYAVIGYTAYAMIELFNPNSTSMIARVVAVRETVAVLISFFVVMYVFDSLKSIRTFTRLWVFLALLAALYGMYQEYFGLPPWDWRWVSADTGGPKLIWGRIRKFSFLSDVSAFGLFMAYGATFCLIMAISKVSFKTRVYLITCGILMTISMTYSGTRTAFAQLILGFVFYVMMSLNDKRTLIFAAAAGFAFMAILFGPFHGGTISRMRSTFEPSEDASMAVRDVKRVRLQPYARENPFGAGINTVGNLGMRYEPGHELAGPFDPDSGYLKMALERGWIGLLVNLMLYGTVMIYGLVHYYKLRDPDLKFLSAAYLSSYFAISVAHFTQDAMDQKPAVVVLMASCAIFVKLNQFDKPVNSKT